MTEDQLIIDKAAQAAYVAYASYLGIFKTPGAKHWKDLSPQRQQGWRNAAIAAGKALK